MCGICGYVGDNVPRLLEPMCQAMAHRGPDDKGTWHDAKSRVGLGHRRLSIIDLSPAGHQPMSNEDGSIWIVFNGEIYDYPELRRSLVARGHVFRSQCDTEVLVHLYEERGKDLLSELNGIFAFAIWDSKKRELLLARDHAGLIRCIEHGKVADIFRCLFTAQGSALGDDSLENLSDGHIGEFRLARFHTCRQHFPGPGPQQSGAYAVDPNTSWSQLHCEGFCQVHYACFGRAIGW